MVGARLRKCGAQLFSKEDLSPTELKQRTQKRVILNIRLILSTIRLSVQYQSYNLSSPS